MQEEKNKQKYAGLERKQQQKSTRAGGWRRIKDGVKAGRRGETRGGGK